jgi:mannose-6-phosphate isomerase-like protein (cupin superfamily)
MHSDEAAGWTGRLLAAAHRRGTFDLYLIDIEAGGARHAEAHHTGVIEHMVVVEGRLRVGPQSGPVELEAGDLVTFAADVPHVYEALESTHAVLLMSYP